MLYVSFVFIDFKKKKEKCLENNWDIFSKFQIFIYFIICVFFLELYVITYNNISRKYFARFDDNKFFRFRTFHYFHTLGNKRNILTLKNLSFVFS